ncbi:TetR/AcrR family transcriptional regulator [Pasteurella testudinis]|uniref:TetR/AcrR family transcriptional regulator n=1 Tax=Pasteurella testudinis TaxID=761 RepID=UPI004057E8BD
MNKLSKSALSLRGPADHSVRNQIIEAATEYFSLYGYQKTTVLELAKAIGFSKAYIYKFFESKQAIGEVICANRLELIINEVESVLADTASATDQLRRTFETLVEMGNNLFFYERKLYDIAAAAASERWSAVIAYEQYLKNLIMQIVQQGRASGEFECKTALEEITEAVYLIMLPYANPLQLQFNLHNSHAAVAHLCKLILRSLTP